mmetsp:Transcript_38084/g.121324  ORF Transcript_38084/g.121324 Transcript_38084/m.121324 type:complete len:208 (-) Transcript_38084:10-633(-)
MDALLLVRLGCVFLLANETFKNSLGSLFLQLCQLLGIDLLAVRVPLMCLGVVAGLAGRVNFEAAVFVDGRIHKLGPPLGYLTLAALEAACLLPDYEFLDPGWAFLLLVDGGLLVAGLVPVWCQNFLFFGLQETVAARRLEGYLAKFSFAGVCLPPYRLPGLGGLLALRVRSGLRFALLAGGAEPAVGPPPKDEIAALDLLRGRRRRG